MSVSLIFANEFQKLPWLLSAFTSEPLEENLSENYGVSQNLKN